MKIVIVKASELGSRRHFGNNWSNWHARMQPSIARQIRLERIAHLRRLCLERLVKLDAEEKKLREKK